MCFNFVRSQVIVFIVSFTYFNSQSLLMFAGALLEILNERLALQFAFIEPVRLHALHHVHFEFTAFIVLLMIDNATS